MQTKREQTGPTKVTLTITAAVEELDSARQAALRRLSKNMKLPGFRPGKAPLAMVERSADQSVLQSEVVDAVLNTLYAKALDAEKLRPVADPQVTVRKFVPFTALEFSAEVEVIGDVNLPDYRKFRLAKKSAAITEKEIDDVIRNLQRRAAEKNEVDRAAKEGDEVIIDFKGTDTEKKQPVRGADGKAYPLLLGSDTFIPGFETNLIGLKPGEHKTFTLKFPGDYGVAALKNRKVTFEVTVSKVHELTEPNVDNAFAGKAGPFKTVEEMRDDIRERLTHEKQTQADREYQNALLEKLAAGTKVAIPELLILEEVDRAEQEVRRNIAYRGQTWQEFLDEQGLEETAYRQTLREPAEERMRGSLALTEVAETELLTVTPEEFRVRMQLLKGQYNDPEMRAELEKPEHARSIMSSMLTEKAIAKLVEYASADQASASSPKSGKSAKN